MPHLARPGGVIIHWEERGSGPFVFLAPFANSEPSVYDPSRRSSPATIASCDTTTAEPGPRTASAPSTWRPGADDLEAVLEQAGEPGVVVAIGDAVHRAARVTARRPDLVDALVVPGGSPAGRERLEDSDALVASDSVLDAFVSMDGLPCRHRRT